MKGTEYKISFCQSFTSIYASELLPNSSVDSTNQVRQGQSNNERQRNLNQMDVSVNDAKEAASRKKWVILDQ